MVRVVSLRIIKGLLALSIFFLLAIPLGAARSQPAAALGARLRTDATTDGVDLAVGGPDGGLAPAGGTTRVRITVANLGQQQAGNVRLTGTIPLGVLVRSPEVTMRCAIRACHWALGELPNLGQGEVALEVTLPANAPPGAIYELRFSASSAQPDALPANNVKVVRLAVEGSGGAVPEVVPEVIPEVVPEGIPPLNEREPAAPQPAAPAGSQPYPYYYPYIRR